MLTGTSMLHQVPEEGAAAVAWYFAEVGALQALGAPSGAPSRTLNPAEAALPHKQA